MKKSEFKAYLREEIISILSEATPEDVENQKELNKALEKTNAELEKTKELMKENPDMVPSVYTDKDLDNLFSIILKYVKDSDEAEKEIERFDTDGFDAMSDYVTANLLRDKDYNDWYNKLHSIKEEEEEMDDDAMDKKASMGAKKGDSVSKIANKLGETNNEMKKIVKKYKDAKEPEKSRLLTRLKELTKIKKELEGLL